MSRPAKKRQQVKTPSQERRHKLLSDEAKAMLRDMRKHGFAPPKGQPTTKQFQRYRAYLSAVAGSSRAAVLRDEHAIINANGGIMHSVFERLHDPKTKSTAYAQLATLVARTMAINPDAFEDTQATEETQVDEDRLEELGNEICGGDA